MLTALLAAVQDAKSIGEAAEYAAREAASPELEHFRGGDALGFLLFVLLVALIVAIVWWLLNHQH